MKKTILLFTLLIMLFSCATSEGSTAHQPEAPEMPENSAPGWNKNKEYTVSLGLYGDLLFAFKEISESTEFKNNFPNVTINFKESDWEGHHHRAMSNFRFGFKGCDIELLDSYYLKEITDKEITPDFLTALDEFGARQHSQDLAAYAVEQAVSMEKRILGMPVFLSPVVMYYRADLTEQAGVDLSTLKSWDELISAARKLTRDTDGDGTIDQFAFLNLSELDKFSRNYGAALWYNEDGNFSPENSSLLSLLQTFEIIKNEQLHADYNSWSDLWIDSFSNDNNGAAAITFQGSLMSGSLKNWIAPYMDDRFRVALLPDGTSIDDGGVTYLTVPKTTDPEIKSLAYDIIRFLTTNKSAQLQFIELIGAIPALTRVYEHSKMHQKEPYFGGQQDRLIYAEAVQQIGHIEKSMFNIKAEELWQNTIRILREENKSAEDIYARTLLQLKELYREYK